MRPIHQLAFAINTVLSKGSYLTQFQVLAIALIFLYMVLLPSLVVGRVTVQALQHLTLVEFVFSILIGSLLTLVTVMNIYALKKIRTRRLTVALSIFASVLPAFQASFVRYAPAFYAYLILVCLYMNNYSSIQDSGHVNCNHYAGWRSLPSTMHKPKQG